MFGLFSLFGRSQDQQRLDQALRQAGLHPKLVPEAVKIAALKQIKGTGKLDDAQCRAAALLLSYCILPAGEFADIHDDALTRQTETRLEAALDDGANLDARLVLLCFYAGLISPDVGDRYDIAGE